MWQYGVKAGWTGTALRLLVNFGSVPRMQQENTSMLPTFHMLMDFHRLVNSWKLFLHAVQKKERKKTTLQKELVKMHQKELLKAKCCWVWSLAKQGLREGEGTCFPESLVYLWYLAFTFLHQSPMMQVSRRWSKERFVSLPQHSDFLGDAGYPSWQLFLLNKLIINKAWLG